jgi:flagellar biosynthetic protein FlhB
MSDADKHSKTEQPTAKKLEEARKKGSPPQSRDLTSTISLLVALVSLYVCGGYMVSTLKNCSKAILSNLASFELTEAGVYSLMIRQFMYLGGILGPFMLMVMFAGLVSTIVQGGVSLSSERILPSLDKLNPVNGVKRFFKKEALVESIKSFVKIFIVGYVAYRILKDEIHAVLYLTETDMNGILDFVGRISFKLVLHSCGMLLILSLLDLAFIKWQFIQNLKMTKQEVKDEHKNAEGDPQVKGKIKRIQFEKAFRRLKQIIPTADVVVTNPTHFAVALKYDRDRMAAPIVIAKGSDHLAQRIKSLAKENNVMLVENRFLARELHAQVKEGEEIPETLYVAVAELLAYVYGLKGMV